MDAHSLFNNAAATDRPGAPDCPVHLARLPNLPGHVDEYRRRNTPTATWVPPEVLDQVEQRLGESLDRLRTARQPA